MSKVDTVEKQPVDSIENDLSAVLDAAESEATDEKEQPEDVETEPETESTDIEPDKEGDESDDEHGELPEDESGDGSEGETEPEADSEALEVDLANSEGEEPDKLEAPEHWSAVDREAFNEQPKGAQEFILKRHKEIEGDYTRKRQQESSQVRLAESVTDALSPYRQEFAAAGLDEAGAVRKLAAVHQALRTDGKSAILNLAQTYGIDMGEDGQEHVDPALANTQSQLSSSELRIARLEQEAQQEKLEALNSSIKIFESEKGTDGKLLHPHLRELEPKMIQLFNAKMATGLDDAYEQALALTPKLNVPAKDIPKASQAEIVAKAKKAATGIKSSGAVGKKPAKAMTLEQEIASQIP